MEKQYIYKKPVDKAELVEVTVPSGNVFLFERPSRFAMIARAGQLPTTAANSAVAAWQEAGILDEVSVTEDQIKTANLVINTAERVVKLSHSPKIVIDTPRNDNEVLIDDIDDKDLEYLFQWVTAGGDVSVMLTTFPERSQSGSLAVASRRKVRKAAK